MRATTFEEFTINRRVRFFSENSEHETEGTVIEVDPVSEHITIAWDVDDMWYERPVSRIDALAAIRQLEVL
jgi:hypothetical protein